MSAVAIEAREWIGTPYRHQASVKGCATDCLGLIRGVWREIYGSEPETVPAYTPDWAEPQREEILLAAATRHLTPVAAGREIRVGECILFRMRDDSVAKHLGLVAQIVPFPTFIHAYSGHGVVENALSQPWVRRIAARFDFPACAGGKD